MSFVRAANCCLLVSYKPLANRPALSDLLLRYCAWIGALPLLPSREALQRCSQRFRGARAPSRPRYKKRRRPTAAKPHSRTIAARRTTCLEARCSVLNQFRPPEREPIVFWTIPASVDGSAVRVRQVRDEYTLKIMALYAVESVIGPQYYE